MFCPKCGSSNPEGARFCRECGNELADLQQEVQNVQYQNSQQQSQQLQIQQQQIQQEQIQQQLQQQEVQQQAPYPGAQQYIQDGPQAFQQYAPVPGNADINDKKAKTIIITVISLLLVVGGIVALIFAVNQDKNKAKKDSDKEIEKKGEYAEDATPEPTYAPTLEPTSTVTSTPTPTPVISGNVGNTVYFGYYEQDNNTSNGKEPIEWIIVAKDSSKALLLSKYILDWKEYKEKCNSYITWEKCSLRKWLNEDFYSNSFSYGEKTLILETTLTNPKNDYDGGSPGGNSTRDKVFILSSNEVESYRANYEFSPTEYAKAQGSDNASDWWLRSSGGYYDLPTVLGLTTFRKIAKLAPAKKHGVRPSIYVSLK